MPDRKFPAPILLGLRRFNIPFGQLGPEPSCQVFPKTTRIYEMLSHLRQVEAARLEENVYSIHQFQV